MRSEPCRGTEHAHERHGVRAVGYATRLASRASRSHRLASADERAREAKVEDVDQLLLALVTPPDGAVARLDVAMEEADLKPRRVRRCTRCGLLTRCSSATATSVWAPTLSAVAGVNLLPLFLCRSESDGPTCENRSA